MDIKQYFLTAMGYIQADSWIIQIFAVVFITLLIAWLQKRIVNRIHIKLEKTKTHWDDAVIDALRRPLTVLIWVTGLTFAAEIAKSKTSAVIFDVAGPIRDVGVIFTIAWFLVRLIERAEKNIIKHRTDAGLTVDRTTVDAITKLLRVSVIITASLVGLQTLGFSISGVLAFGGIGGIAVGFAAKDLLANFFGGLTIYMDRPFAVGDWIRSPDREIEGTVEHIGWRLTRIRTFDKRPLYVPNSVFTSVAVENPSRMTNRRIYETIGVRYEDAGRVAKIVADVKTMLKAHPEIDTNQTMIVNLNKFASSSLDFFVYTFTKTTNWVRFHEIKEDVMLKIIEIIESHGAECALPTSTIHVPDGVSLVQPEA